VVSRRLSTNSRVVMRCNFKLVRVALVRFLLEAEFYFKFIYYSNVKILRLLPSENMSILACAKAKEAGSVAVSTCIEKDLICQQIKQMVLTKMDGTSLH
jgi:hypothetical protein